MNLIIRFFRLLRLFFRYNCDFWASNIFIAKQVLSKDPGISPEIIIQKTKVHKPSEILALANMITFTPGTLVLGIEPDGDLEVHALNDGDKAREAIRNRLEEPLLKITRRPGES